MHLWSSCAEIHPERNFHCLPVKHRAQRDNVNIPAPCWYPEHNRSQQRQTFSCLRNQSLSSQWTWWPGAAQSLSSPSPDPGERFCSVLHYLLVLWRFFPPSPMFSDSQIQQVLRSDPWGTSGTLILDLAVRSGSPVLWASTPMLCLTPCKQWLYLLFRFSPNKRCHLHCLTLTRPVAELCWKCLIVVFKIFLRNAIDKMLLV